MYVGDDRYNLLPEENITTNLHHDGVTPDSFVMNQRLSSLFSVLSTNRDSFLSANTTDLTVCLTARRLCWPPQPILQVSQD